MEAQGAVNCGRVLSSMGHASLSDTRAAILAGRLKVNGRVIRDPECWVRPGRDHVEFDGLPLKPARKLYYLFYKPKGVITSHGDPAGRKTVYDYLGEEKRWVFPVGRLDKDTSGLLLLTHDTQFADFINNPSSRIPKTYLGKTSMLSIRGG